MKNVLYLYSNTTALRFLFKNNFYMYEEEKNLAVFLNTSEFEVYIELHV
jgi:hypothetical protein